jgi:hypothetical protein
MSFQVYISRQADPFDDSGPAISAEDWLHCIGAEPDFRVPEGDESKWLGKHARIWSDYKYPMAFDWVSGQIEVKNPDAQTIVRMKKLAGKLSATIFSETGELYDESGGHAGFLPGFP